MNAIDKKRAAVTTGSVVAFNKEEDAVWYRVVSTIGKFGIEIQEDGTSYATSVIDRCYVAQVKAA